MKPEFINRDITENMEEGIILFDTDLYIIFINTAVRRLLNINENDTGSLRLQDFILEKNIPDDEFIKLDKQGHDSFRVRVNLLPAGTGQKIPVDLKVKKIIDSYKDVSGYLMIISRSKHIEQLKTLYKITDRELQIVLQLAHGKTYKDIADLFGLAQKTVETHVSNIYNKLLVSNRIEFLNVVSGFNSMNGAEKAPN